MTGSKSKNHGKKQSSSPSSESASAAAPSTAAAEESTPPPPPPPPPAATSDAPLAENLSPPPPPGLASPAAGANASQQPPTGESKEASEQSPSDEISTLGGGSQGDSTASTAPIRRYIDGTVPTLYMEPILELEDMMATASPAALQNASHLVYPFLAVNFPLSTIRDVSGFTVAQCQLCLKIVQEHPSIHLQTFLKATECCVTGVAGRLYTYDLVKPHIMCWPSTGVTPTPLQSVLSPQDTKNLQSKISPFSKSTSKTFALLVQQILDLEDPTCLTFDK